MILKIKEKKDFGYYFCLIFGKPEAFNFYPGQYLDIKLAVDDPNGDTRAFTISSSPTESFLMVTIKKGISPFKKYLETLRIGDTLESSHPAGTFTLDENSPAIFIAGGIGITPFRSMIKYAVDQKLKTAITLIFSNSNNDFPFKEELGQWQKDYPKLDISYHNSTNSGRLNKLPVSNAIYYLAGSHSFVNSMEKILLDLGMDQTNIRYDRFDGYN